RGGGGLLDGASGGEGRSGRGRPGPAAGRSLHRLRRASGRRRGQRGGVDRPLSRAAGQLQGAEADPLRARVADDRQRQDPAPAAQGDGVRPGRAQSAPLATSCLPFGREPTLGGSMTQYSTVLVDRADGVATVTLNRPEKRNAMNPQLHLDMVQVLEELRYDE